jgi:hypothetical protein
MAPTSSWNRLWDDSLEDLAQLDAIQRWSVTAVLQPPITHKEKERFYETFKLFGTDCIIDGWLVP